jgi:multidrug efflux system membrane fusion protein
MLIVNQFRPIAVYFTLPEDQLQRVLTKLRQDHKLNAVAFDRSDTTQLETGQLTATDNQIDVTTGTDKLKAVFGNADEKLFPNQFVNVHLILEQRKDSIVVPAAAVQHGTDSDYVWLVKPDNNTTAANSGPANSSSPANSSTSDRPAAGSNTGSSTGSNGGGAPGSGPRPGSGTVVMQPIVIDTTQGAMVILKSGLEANQQVVVDGADKLQNGAKVSTTAAVSHRVQKQQQQQQLGPS